MRKRDIKRARKLQQKRDSGIARVYVLSNALAASGGNGLIREAVDKKTHEKCAVKWIKNVFDKTAVRRFKNEIQMLEKCADVPGVMHIIKYDESYLWYSMSIATPFHNVSEQLILQDVNPDESNVEFQKRMGENLHQFIELFLHLAIALKRMHDRGIAHRDIKPANILFLDGKPLFIDFGLAVDKETPLDVTTDARALGAKFTMAPEMRRNPSTADYFKADVYSLAKTLWIYLAGCPTGFEGAYSPWDKLYGLRSFDRFRKAHLAELEKLLICATDADPAKRPTMDEFVEYLEIWLKTDQNYRSREAMEWCFMGELLSGNCFGNTIIWRTQNDIYRVLKRISDTLTSSHALFSDMGGLDYTDVIEVAEDNCIGLILQGRIEILRPKELRFEIFPDHPSWNYMLLELDELEAKDSDGSMEEEILTEDEPGHYVPRECFLYGVYDYDSGGKLPETAREVVRRLRGRLLFPFKFGLYNGMRETYDGRHANVSADEFRKYVAALIKQNQEGPPVSISHIGMKSSMGAEICSETHVSNDANESFASDEYRKQNATSWHYTGGLTTSAPQGKLKYCFLFYPSRFRSWTERPLYLSSDGHLVSVDEGKSELLYVYSPSDAELLLASLNRWSAELCEAAGYHESSYEPFSIQQEKNGTPQHMFTRKELEELMRAADDRVCNTLVVDDDGRFKMIQDRTLTWKYALTIEYFIPYTNQVGPYSSLSALDELYSRALDNWLYYLQYGREKRTKMPVIEDAPTVEEKIRQIYSINEH